MFCVLDSRLEAPMVGDVNDNRIRHRISELARGSHGE